MKNKTKTKSGKQSENSENSTSATTSNVISSTSSINWSPIKEHGTTRRIDVASLDDIHKITFENEYVEVLMDWDTNPSIYQGIALRQGLFRVHIKTQYHGQVKGKRCQIMIGRPELEIVAKVRIEMSMIVPDGTFLFFVDDEMEATAETAIACLDWANTRIRYVQKTI